MTKTEAIKIFGGKACLLANALGKSKGAISMWPEQLTNDQINIVIGAAVRSGKQLPKNVLKAG